MEEEGGLSGEALVSIASCAGDGKATHSGCRRFHSAWRTSGIITDSAQTIDCCEDRVTAKVVTQPDF